MVDSLILISPLLPGFLLALWCAHVRLLSAKWVSSSPLVVRVAMRSRRIKQIAGGFSRQCIPSPNYRLAQVNSHPNSSVASTRYHWNFELVKNKMKNPLIPSTPCQIVKNFSVMRGVCREQLITGRQSMEKGKVKKHTNGEL